METGERSLGRCTAGVFCAKTIPMEAQIIAPGLARSLGISVSPEGIFF